MPTPTEPRAPRAVTPPAAPSRAYFTAPLPRYFVAGVVALTVTPTILMAAGVDLAIGRHVVIHAIMEWSALCILVLTAGLALAHYVVDRGLVEPLIGFAALNTVALEALHAVTADHHVGYTWVIARGYQGAVFALSATAAVLARRHGPLPVVVAVSATVALLIPCVARLSAVDVAEPTTAVRLAPLAIFLAACLPSFAMLHARSARYVSAALLVSLIPHVAAELHLVLAGPFGSPESQANAAHFLKLIGYGVPMVGLCLDYLHSHGTVAARTSEAGRRRSEQRFEDLVNSVDGIVWEAELDPLSYTFVSEKAKSMLGYPSSAWRDPDFWPQHLHEEDREQAMAFRAAATADGRNHEFEYRMLDSQGDVVWLRDIVTVVREGGRTTQRGITIDITTSKEAEASLLHHALHDALTSLPNRTLFSNQLAGAMARARRRDDYLYAVLVLDLDRFKVVNDSLGHETGDTLLVALSERLRACLRDGDVVARLGGDEFAILLDDMGTEERPLAVATRIHDLLREPFHLVGQDVFAAASIGMVTGTSRYEKADDILRDADTALNDAKAAGRGRHQVFDSRMRDQAVSRLRLETELRRAIERGEFMIHYQPIVSLSSGAIDGFEALVRWQHPTRGLVFPAEFIPLAEETGLILELGDWALREACTQLRRWQEQFSSRDELSVSVNLSARQFAEPFVVERVRAVLADTGVPPSSVILEITESVIIQGEDEVTARLNELRDLGVGLQVDDFGTGYSSLSYVERLPIHSFKIDRSFVAGLDQEVKWKIVRTIVSLALNLELDVIAEGIEEESQLERLRDLGCRHGQGYYFSRPLPADEVADLLGAARPGW